MSPPTAGPLTDTRHVSEAISPRSNPARELTGRRKRPGVPDEQRKRVRIA
jgi:hypothetical protein